jgi:hypothetical protein
VHQASVGVDPAGATLNERLDLIVVNVALWPYHSCADRQPDTIRGCDRYYRLLLGSVTTMISPPFHNTKSLP